MPRSRATASREHQEQSPPLSARLRRLRGEATDHRASWQTSGPGAGNLREISFVELCVNARASQRLLPQDISDLLERRSSSHHLSSQSVTPPMCAQSWTFYSC